MLRKLLPVLACIVVLVGVIAANSVVRGMWEAEEAAAFRSNEDSIIAADLEQSAHVDPIGSLGSSSAMVPASDVSSDVEHLSKVLSGDRKDGLSAELEKVFVLGKDVKADITLMSYDGSERRYLVYVQSGGVSYATVVGVVEGEWSVYMTMPASEVTGDGK